VATFRDAVSAGKMWSSIEAVDCSDFLFLPRGAGMMVAVWLVLVNGCVLGWIDTCW
jgi:hypothetical protein